MKPYSDACEENKQPILEVLRNEFAHSRSVLEIGSGTGQHAVFFAAQLPHLTWQTSDVRDAHAGIQAWLDEARLSNVQPPLSLDVARDDWPQTQFEGVFSANTAHIMSWPEVEMMFAGVGRILVTGARFCLYGPFNYQGRFTSESNARFDQWLKARDPLSGVRDFEALDKLAASVNLVLRRDYEMPVNNRTLVWEKQA